MLREEMHACEQFVFANYGMINRTKSEEFPEKLVQ